MIKFYLRLIFISLLFGFSGCKKETGIIKQTIADWQFRQSGDSVWLPAEVPGCVHIDLLKNEIIEDPYYGNNETKLQWIEKENWEYKALFEADDNLLKHIKTELIFEGLDTYADVYLNDSLILKADNMFREWAIECRKFLKTGENELLIKFISPVYNDSVKASMLPYKLPDERAFTRKAPYQYGWDWGPRFVTSGIWKPVYIRAWDDARIADVQVVQNKFQPDTAFLTANFEIESVQKQGCKLQIFDSDSESPIAELSASLFQGLNIIPFEFIIASPNLWWPNGMGDQYLYTLEFRIKTATSVDSIREKIGLRTVELVQEKDSVGESFFFRVNGIPVFMKGANYIPQDNFPSRVTDERYENVIQSVVDANMNMLRVWGGGIYENDIFYDLCDQKGLLVWQDFMFACNMYPGDTGFIENVKEETVQKVKRLRNHPCLALWCGNNEIDEGWHNWGWQKALGYSLADSTEIWLNYLKIFEELLPKTLKSYSPYIPYIPSSPRIGWGHEEASNEGDMHYWGVWWGEEPFGIYEEKVGRFMSEYGFQGFPDIKTLDSCLGQEDLILSSNALLNHQKHPKGMELIQTYMEREYKVPESFEDYAYVSQLVQAYGIRKAIEAHRRAMPVCMGTLYWQLNDCWQVISWSSTDYYHRWKALHYFVRDAYSDLLVSFESEKEIVKVFIVSDRLTNTQVEFDLKIMDFEGKIFWESNTNIEVQSSSSKAFANIDVRNVPMSNHFMIGKLLQSDSVLAMNCYYFVPPKDLRLPAIEIKKEIEAVEEGYLIRLTSDKLAKNVFLCCDADGFFSDNYFDLIPGETKRITFHTKRPKAEDLKSLKLTYLNYVKSKTNKNKIKEMKSEQIGNNL
jgi:beta-mannosidase